MSSNDPLSQSELPTKRELSSAEPAGDGVATQRFPKPEVQSTEMRPETILGVEYEILIKFLKLFRDHYRKCEKATTFLETRTDIPNITSIANQRDAISHFKSALQENTSREKRLEQYATAEEHFRRAIIEPYETALSKKMDQLFPVIANYRENVLPVRDRYAELDKYPDGEALEKTFREIARLRDAARTAKGRNIWDEVWEQGVEDYVFGFDIAHDLLINLENAVFQFQQIQKDEEQRGEIARLKAEIDKLRKVDEQ